MSIDRKISDGNLYQSLPRVDVLLERYEDTGLGREYLKTILHDVLDSCRKNIQNKKIVSVEQAEEYIGSETRRIIKRLVEGPLRRVINGTGVVLHTNLGRAVYAVSDLSEMASHYCNLEYDLETGERGSRNSHIAEYLKILTGAEAAIAVNNNAAAVMLVLTALSYEREVMVSRGEQVEIGGSFRIPEVAQLSGAVLRELGTTNRTRMTDYENACTENTAMVMRVEPSNYAVIGQVGRPTNEEIHEFTKKKEIPYYIDLGSGVFDLGVLKNAVSDEEAQKKDIMKAVRNADLVSFSGDKLMGSSQAGIIVGKKKYIDVLSRHPLYRAMRLDKLSIYALTKTLKAALFKESALVADLIRLNAEELKSRVHRFIRSFRQNVKSEQEYNNSIDNGKLILSGIPIKSGIGGGTFAISEIESYGLEIKIPHQNINSVAKSLRNAEVPLIGRIEDESIILDFRTIMKDDEGLLKLILKNLMYNISLT